MREVRRAKEIPQSDLGTALGVADSTVAGWELGTSVPDQERLPALAAVLGRPLDDLFPRGGPPDLTDLRCDAGIYRYGVVEIIGTKSDGPVAGAEQGVRRLRDKYVPALAAAYRVSEQELRAAEDRSFAKARGEEVQEEPAASAGAESTPRSLAEKITYLLGQMAQPLTDAEIAERGNRGTRALDEDLVRKLRTGVVTNASGDVLDGLAEALDTTRLYFESNDASVQQVIAETMVLKDRVVAIAARGGGAEGLPAELLAFINKEVDKARAEVLDRPGRSASD
ncbi:helix-turn-helix transcriptional regulator [Streptomyces sp. NPDC004042]|uniref:helix-turn-helix transcriptional regulator n=1 Tax=Streptomyces sp. NPDC004042 TaxID=3154451 RepID=UPI0033BB86A0